jgi:hypothetical protein
MTSVLIHQRQRDQANTFFQAPTNAIYYVFFPTSGNYIGNYTPGYMEVARNATPQAGEGILIRDMGKTVRASITSYSQVNPGYFRAVQLIKPVAAVSATGSTNFGIDGTIPGSITPGNIGDMGYRTYYIPISIDGTLASLYGVSATSFPNPYLPMGGQM